MSATSASFSPPTTIFRHCSLTITRIMQCGGQVEKRNSSTSCCSCKMDVLEFTPGGLHLAIVIAGFPDTCDVFRGNVVRTLKQHDFHVVGITLPEYECRSDSLCGVPSPSTRGTFGWSLPALVEMFRATVSQIVCQSESRVKGAPRQKPLLVCHDWGSIIAFECMASEPEMFRAVVCFDVAGHVGGDVEHRISGWRNVSSWLVGQQAAVPWRTMVYVLWYQLWIMIVYIADWLFPIIPKLSLELLCWLTKRPVYRSLRTGLVVQPRPDMGYPYFDLMRGLLTRTGLTTMQCLVSVAVPVLYLYGTSKPFQFHSNKWLRHIVFKGQSDRRSKVVPVEGGGHWFFAEGGHTQAVAMQHVDTFLHSLRHQLPRC